MPYLKSRTEEVQESFLRDALKLSVKAKESIRMLVEQNERQWVSPAEVRTLFRLVHSIKGTASMVADAQEVVSALEKLEDHLTNTPVTLCARETAWIDWADRAIHKTHQALLDMQDRLKWRQWRAEKLAEVGTPPEFIKKSSPPQGYTSQAFQKGLIVVVGANQFFVTFDSIKEILNADELVCGSERLVFCHQGQWVPVIRSQADEHDSTFALVIQNPQASHDSSNLKNKTAIFLVHDIVKSAFYSEAKQLGVGLDIWAIQSGNHANIAA